MSEDTPSQLRLSDATSPEGVARERLGRVMDLAQLYADCDLKSLAKALRRDPTRLVCATGNPKVDLVAGLAQLLEWPIADVVHAIRGDCPELDETFDDPDACDSEYERLGYEELNQLSFNTHRAGQWKEMLAVANAMLAKSTSNDDRAVAFARIGAAYDGMGRYANALKALQTGLGEQGVSSRVRVMLRVNLSNAHYTLWHLVEARAIAGELISTLEQPSSLDRLEKSSNAAARYVRGNTLRRMITEEPDAIDQLCARARADLEASQELYLALADEFDDNTYRGVANTCAGALLEVDAASGALDPVEAVRRIEAGLEEVIDPESIPAGDQLESWGWWAIFGSNIALRHVPIASANEQIARFQEHLQIAAEALDNWAFRAEACTIELKRRDRAQEAGIPLDPWKLTPESMSTLIHTMGRLPAFQETGWRILNEYGALETAKKELPKRWKAS